MSDPAPAAEQSETTLLVRFQPAATETNVSEALAQAGVVPDATIRQLDIVVAAVPDNDLAGALESLRSNQHVAYAELNATATATAVSNDPQSLEWTLTLPHVPEAWAITTGAPSIKIAVIDSGVDPTQPDLQGALGDGVNVISGGSWADTNGHGTEVAGTIAARANNGIGVAGTCPACTVLPVKVLDGPAGQPAQGTFSDVATGIVWATDHGARIINLSLSSPYSSQTLEDAVAYARQRGVVVVAAAGNDASPAPAYPSSLPGVIGVAATDSADNRYSFSNYGQWVSLAAPGCVVTTKPGGVYGNACGTSFSSPFVAGVAGLALTYKNGALTATQVADALRTGATLLPGNWLFGGRVDALGTLRALGASIGAAPANLAPPTISGVATVGSTVSASTGSWSGAPTSYAYAWSRCESGGSCQPIAGAATASYPIVAADAGTVIQVTVTASNGAGSASAAGTLAVTTSSAPPSQPAAASPAASNGGSAGSSAEAPAATPAPAPATSTAPAPIAPPADQAPSSTSPVKRSPTAKLQGSALVGKRLSVSASLGKVVSIRWQIRRDGHWLTVGGATAHRLALPTKFVGRRVRAAVTGIVSNTTATTFSAPSAPVRVAARRRSAERVSEHETAIRLDATHRK